MGSSPPADIVAPWRELQRLRDGSRLILAALERNDIDAVARQAAENAAILEGIPQNVLSDDLDDIRRMHQRMVEVVEERRAALASELGRAHATRRALGQARLTPPEE
jgi:hypothetical protein